MKPCRSKLSCYLITRKVLWCPRKQSYWLFKKSQLAADVTIRHNTVQKQKVPLTSKYGHLSPLYRKKPTGWKISTREMLNRLYDNFSLRFGLLNDKKNLDLIKMDARGTEILSLERYIDGKAVKSDIFNRPVAFNPNEVTSVDNPHEALAASLNKYAGVNLGYMALLTGNTVDELKEELKGRYTSIQ